MTCKSFNANCAFSDVGKIMGQKYEIIKPSTTIVPRIVPKIVRTVFANSSAFFSPSFSSTSVKTGKNAAEIAPSPKIFEIN